MINYELFCQLRQLRNRLHLRDLIDSAHLVTVGQVAGVT